LRWTAEGARSAKRACEPFTPFPVWRLTSWFLVTKIQMTVSIRNEDNFAGRNPRLPDERVSRKGGFVVWPREGRDCSQSTGPAARSGRSCGWLVLLLRYDKSQFGLCDPTDVDRDHSYLVTPGRVRRQFAGDQARLFVDRQHQRRGLLHDEELDVV